MSQLDDELSRALQADSNEAMVTPVTQPAEKPNPKRNLGLLAALLTMGGVLLVLVMNFQESAVYAKSVDQLMADKARLTQRAVRVEGTLVKGSLERQEMPCEYRFKMASNGAEVPVRYANCVVPDTFRDVPGMDVKVTVEGKLSQAGTFEASQVMAKCPSKYEMKEQASQGAVAPHTQTN